MAHIILQLSLGSKASTTLITGTYRLTPSNNIQNSGPSCALKTQITKWGSFVSSERFHLEVVTSLFFCIFHSHHSVWLLTHSWRKIFLETFTLLLLFHSAWSSHSPFSFIFSYVLPFISRFPMFHTSVAFVKAGLEQSNKKKKPFVSVTVRRAIKSGFKKYSKQEHDQTMENFVLYVHNVIRYAFPTIS